MDKIFILIELSHKIKMSGEPKTAKFFRWFIFTANFHEDREYKDVRRTFIFILAFAALFSGVRQIVRLRLLSFNYFDNSVSPDVDYVNVLMTVLLTVTFYPLLYITFSYIYKRDEEQDTTRVLYNVALVSQLAILRDVLYVLYNLLILGFDFLPNAEDEYYVDYDFIFRILDGALWALTIMYLVPLVINRLHRPKQNDDTQLLAYSLSLLVFWVTWIFNFVIVRIFIQLPLGGDF
ncbi:MAG: hypothetical protein IH859_01780 [Chloroflexi bacterium]|nr:hypothetical protein [Chloroflexota bacterium]